MCVCVVSHYAGSQVFVRASRKVLVVKCLSNRPTTFPCLPLCSISADEPSDRTTNEKLCQNHRSVESVDVLLFQSSYQCRSHALLFPRWFRISVFFRVFSRVFLSTLPRVGNGFAGRFWVSHTQAATMLMNHSSGVWPWFVRAITCNLIFFTFFVHRSGEDCWLAQICALLSTPDCV